MKGKFFKFGTVILVTVIAAAFTKGAMKVWPQVRKAIKESYLAKPGVLPESEHPVPVSEESEPICFEVDDRLVDEGWLLASADSTVALSYAVILGKSAATLSASGWEEMGRTLHASDTIRPKQDCVLAIRAESENGVVEKYYAFDYGAFVEKLLRSREDSNVLRDALFSFSAEEPMTISYDYIMEDRCASQEEDFVNIELVYERICNDELCHVDSIRSYLRKPPADEALERSYPPVSFISFKSQGGEL